MKEFKLLDLNEGKILELGKDFLYGGRYIAYIEDVDGNKVDLETFEFDEYSSKMDYISVHKTPFSKSIRTKLIPILEETGAELFGDRYVLLNSRLYGYLKNKEPLFYGDLVLIKFDGFPLTHPSYDVRMVGGKYILQDCRYSIEKKVSNIFQEYFFFLKREPNKFEEFCELVKGV